MATQSHNNYTITNVTYSVTAGVNVHTLHPTAVLTITPDAGYSITAEDFSWANTTLANINTVVFTQDGVNVVCTVTFDNPFNMPSANTVRSLCINGAAVLQRLSVSGSYQATGSSTNMTIVENSPVPEEIYYELSGVEGYQVLVIEKTYTAASGYYFNGSFNISYTGDEMVAENYNCIETETLDSSGRLTSINIKFYYTFPNNSVINDKIVVEVPATKQIKVPSVKITGYDLNTAPIGPSGCYKTIRVFGAPTATFTLASNNGSILNINTFDASENLLVYATTPTLTIPTIGYFDVFIIIPESSSNATYCLTLGGGNLISPFPQTNPVCLYQYKDVSLTFTASGTGLSITSTPTSLVKTFPALSTATPGSDSYNATYAWTVQGSNGETLSLDDPALPTFTNYPVVAQQLSSAISNTNVLPFDSVTGLTVGMRTQPIDNYIQGFRTITNISGNNVTIDGVSVSLINDQIVVFDNRKGSELFLDASASLDSTSTVATVNLEGYIEKYGDDDQTFDLNMLGLLTIGSSNPCKEFNVTVGNDGGIVTYFDCIKKIKRQLFVFKGQNNFSICALQTPVPTVTGSISIAASGDVCDLSGVDATCATWTIAYNHANVKFKSVDVTYFDCITLAEKTITVGRGSSVTQCATRQTPVSSDQGDGGATITLVDLTCTP